MSTIAVVVGVISGRIDHEKLGPDEPVNFTIVIRDGKYVSVEITPVKHPIWTPIVDELGKPGSDIIKSLDRYKGWPEAAIRLIDRIVAMLISE